MAEPKPPGRDEGEGLATSGPPAKSTMPSTPEAWLGAGEGGGALLPHAASVSAATASSAAASRAGFGDIGVLLLA